MVLFRYRATNTEGKEIKGTIDSASKETAMDALKQLQLEPIEVIEGAMREAAISQSPIPSKKAAPIKSEEIQKEISQEKPVETKSPLPISKSSQVENINKPAKPLAKKEEPKPVSAPKQQMKPLRNLLSKLPTKKEILPLKRMAPVQQKKPEATGLVSEESVSAEKKESVPFTPRKKDVFSAKQPKQYYAPLFSTLRLYAGWLFAWYGLVTALGYYSYMRDMPFNIPFVQGLFLSSLVFSFLLATFLFLMLTSFHRIAKGGALNGLLMSIAGITVFYFLRQNI